MLQAAIDPQRWRAAEAGYHPAPWEAVPHRVRRSSRGLPWRGLWAWQQDGPVEDLYVAPAAGHCIILRRGPATQLLQRQGGESRLRQWATGEVVIVPAGTPTFWRSDQPRDNVHIDILPQWLEAAAGDRGPVRLAPSFGRRDPLLAQLVNVVLASLEDSTALHPAFGETMATCIAVHLVEHYADTPASRAHTWALSARQLRRLTDYVQAHLAAPCEVARLAAEVGLSAAHFSRCFKATCGVTPHQFVTRLKMEHARTLLLDGGLPVADVGQAVGFTSRAHFAQVFRRHWGAAPAALRRQA